MSEFLQKSWDKHPSGKSQAGPLAMPLQTAKTLDVVMMFDTTGSMHGHLEEVRRELSRLVSEIHKSIPNARIGVIAYSDYGESYVTKALDLTSDFDAVRDFVRSVEPTGGRDFPEAVEEALHHANMLSWRIGSSRAAVLVGDAPPHGAEDPMQQYDYKTEAHGLAQKGIKIYATQCGAYESTEQVFRWLAKESAGTYLKLENIRDLVDLLIGICLKEVGLLDSYIKNLTTDRLLTDSKAKVLKQLKGA